MKKLILSLTMIIAAVGVNAQILYRVTGKDAKGTSYVMGTHHVAPVSMLDNVKGFAEALDAVEAVYGEVDQAELQSPATQQYMMKLAMAPADSTLSKVLPAAQLDSLNTVLQKYTMGMANAQAFDPMTPATVMIQLSMLQSMQAFPDFNPQEQLDITIQAMAAQKGKANGGLESAESQVNILLGKPISAQAEDLMKMVRNDDKSAEMAHKLADAYLAQNLDELWALTLEDETDAADLDRLIFGRNRAWVEKIPVLIAERPMMFVVGAGHLPSDQGVLELLRKAGYTVEPVK